ncbi:MAG TPA: prepilin-type N-terminal cleavage/methylation domain-containing protein, partial [Anaerolineaceae bacterium]
MRGFSLLELLIAMAMFLVVGGAAFSLFNQNVLLATRQQNLSGVNIGLRSAMSQLEMDLSGAGQNVLAGAPNAGSFSPGIVIHNNVPGVAAACTPAAGWAYPVPSACFDSLTIINPNPAAPVLVVADPGGSGDLNRATLFADDRNNPGNDAALNNDVPPQSPFYKDGDELLVLYFTQPGGALLTCDPNQPANQSTYCMGVITLTKDAQVTGHKILLQHRPTGDEDPLGILGNSGFTKANGLNFPFPNTTSYIVDLSSSVNGGSAITYAVLPNPANPSNTQLVRCAAKVCDANNGQPLTDQVIGFKVGAALFDSAHNTDVANYFYNSANYCNGANADCSATPPPANAPDDFT